MTVTYFGHSAFQIETHSSSEVETEGTTLLFDPFITGNTHTEGAVSPGDLSPDVILLTHAHGDHFGDTLDIAKRTGALVVGQFEIANYLNAKGHDNTHPMNTGGSWDFEWGRVTNTYARHSSSFPDGTYGGLAGGFLLEIEGKTVYNAGDTCRFAEMAWIGKENDPRSGSRTGIDLCFLPIGDDFTMGIDEAVEAVKMLTPNLTVPVHYNTFPYIMADPAEFVSKMGDAGFEAQALEPGETLEL